MSFMWFLLGAVFILAVGGLLVPDGVGAAEAIIKRRYARGEIDRETFERMLDDVGRDAQCVRARGADAQQS